MRHVAYAAFAVAWLGPAAASAATSTPLAEMSLEDLLDVEVAVASLNAQPSRRSPGIVTVLTHDELVASGARDLIDALGLVPGLSFSHDVLGVVGVVVRGNWAHEGKILVLVDGIPWNETQYGTVGFGNRFPIALVERIEVIRGPGSVVHGGYAELGVINIVTLAAAGDRAVTVAATYGQMAGAGAGGFGDRFARRTLALSGGLRIGDDARVFGRAVIGEGQRGDGVYTDFGGGSYDLIGNADLDPWNGAVGLTWRGLSAQLAFERYRLTYRDGYDAVWDGPEPIELHFSAVAGEVAYRVPVGARHVVTPYLRVLHQRPWSYPQDFVVGTFFYFGTASTRTSAGVTVASELTERLSLVVGADGYLERSVVSPESPPVQQFAGGASQIDYLNGTVFAETTLHTPDVDLTAGARAEVHSVTGLTVVPRVAATTSRGSFHAKALVAQGFRAPSVQNVRLAPDIQAEKTTSLELEVGRQLGEQLSISANVFDITITDPIIYRFDVDTMLDSYVNAGRTGSRGVEAVGRLRTARVEGTLGYAFYDAGKNRVDDYRVPGSTRRLLGAPSHKLTLHGTVRVAPSVAVSPSVIVLGDRYGQASADADGVPVVARFEPALLLTVVATVADVGTPGLDLSLGVHDLLDQQPPFLQAYAAGHAPYPGPGREVVVRLIYER